MRGGMSALGRRAASSHTGALAGSAEVFKAAARQAGVITTSDPDEALDVASLLAYLPLPAGRRVAVVTLGGGWGVLTADALAENGLQLAELPPDVARRGGRLAAAVLEPGQPHRPRGYRRARRARARHRARRGERRRRRGHHPGADRQPQQRPRRGRQRPPGAGARAAAPAPRRPAPGPSRPARSPSSTSGRRRCSRTSPPSWSAPANRS